MPSLYQISLASAVLALSAAAPFSNSNKKLAQRSGFSVLQTANPNYTSRNGKAAVARAIRKFGHLVDTGPIRFTGLLADSSDDDPSSVSATPDKDDSQYLSPVTIGGQKFILDFDTGSSDLWVFGPGVSGRDKVYKPNGTAQAGETWSIQYGDGSEAGGKVFLDTVTIGETTVTGQAIEAATTASDEFIEGVEDGLLGLAFNSINTVKKNGKSAPQKTWFDNAVDQGLNPLFACDLRKGEAGSYDFGHLDESKYTGKVAYTEIDNSQGFWMFTPDDASVGQPEMGVADTGTTLLFLADETVAAYYAKVKGAKNDVKHGGYTFPCNAKLPDYSITVGGYTATVPGSFMNYAETKTSGICFGGIQSDADIGFAIYGDIFLKSQYVVFDLTKQSPRLGLAAKPL